MAHDDLKWLREEGRCGWISISRVHLFDSDVRKFFGDGVVVVARPDYGLDRIEYLIYHPNMEPTDDSYQCSFYKLFKDPSGVLTLEKKLTETTYYKEQSLIRVEGVTDYESRRYVQG